MTAAPPPGPDLSYERSEVLAFIAGSPMSRPAPNASGPSPLRPVPPAVEARLANRAAAGLEPAGTGYPRAGVWQRVVAPSGALAAADAVGVIAAAATGHALLAVLAAVLFVPLAAIAAFGARFAAGDPLRLTAADRKAIASASRWESRQDWTGPFEFGTERGLVIAAARTAERVAGSPAWRSGRLDDQRVRLDLAFELDQIDDQAHRIAVARQGPTSPGAAPVADAAWEAALDRVAALTAYANELDGSAQRRRDELARQSDPVTDSDLMAGSVRDQFAFDQLVVLTAYLSASRGDS
jgi:hypothetical protein